MFSVLIMFYRFKILIVSELDMNHKPNLAIKKKQM